MLLETTKSEESTGLLSETKTMEKEVAENMLLWNLVILVVLLSSLNLLLVFMKPTLRNKVSFLSLLLILRITTKWDQEIMSPLLVLILLLQKNLSLYSFTKKMVLNIPFLSFILSMRTKFLGSKLVLL